MADVDAGEISADLVDLVDDLVDLEHLASSRASHVSHLPSAITRRSRSIAAPQPAHLYRYGSSQARIVSGPGATW